MENSKNIKNRQIIRDNPPPYIIRQYIEQQTCWICHRSGWKALSQHLVKKHGLPAAEVRELAYMFKRERLISEELSEYLSKNALFKFGKRRHIPIQGIPAPKHILSTKAKDMVREKAKIIRPLAAIAQSKRRRKHFCKICGKPIETSRPQYCSEQCVTVALSKATKKNMTPERIAFFKTVLYKATPEEQKRTAQKYWESFHQLPVEKQREISLKKALSRRLRVNKNCVICGKSFDVIPSQADKRVTCCALECKRQNQSNKSKCRKHTPESIAKMSAYAKARHINEPLFGKQREKGEVMNENRKRVSNAGG